MQAKTSQNFTARLERVKFSLGKSDEEMADVIGLSRRMLYLMRTGKSPITNKSWWKLEQAESLAGLVTLSPDIARAENPVTMSPVPSDGNAPEAKSQRLELREDRPGYGARRAAAPTMEDLIALAAALTADAALLVKRAQELEAKLKERTS